MIKLNRLEAYFLRCVNRCPYLLGAKWKLGLAISLLIGTHVDCSGFIRWLFFACSEDMETMPDGSVNQQDWVIRQGWRKLAKYSDVQFAAKDESRLFICFVKPIGKISGHVWLVRSGMTMESRGGKGVSSRHWNMLFARLRKATAYEVPCE